MDDQPVGPVAPSPRLGTLAETPNTVKVWKWGERTIVLLCADQRVMAENTEPITRGQGGIYWNLQRDVPAGGVSENCSLCIGISWSCSKADLLKCIIPGTEHAPLNKGKRWGSWAATSCPQSISSLPTALPPLANTHGVHNQVEVLKLPTSLSSRPGEPLLIPAGTIIWLLCPLRWRGSMFRHTRKPLTKFTQQALNDSQQNPSLLSTTRSSVRKAVLQNRVALDIIAALQGDTWATIQTECCVFLSDESLMSPLLSHMRIPVKEGPQ